MGSEVATAAPAVIPALVHDPGRQDLFTIHPARALVAQPVLAFDFDSTLHPYRKRGPAADLTARVLAKLAREFNIVIFSNRSSSGAKATQPLYDYAALVDSFSGRTGTIGVWAALGASSAWRKAGTAMWDDYTAFLSLPPQLGAGPVQRPDTPPWTEGSIYVGDAGGRPGDFAATDYAFARNIGLRFLVPEQVFANGGVPWGRPGGVGCDADAGYSAADLRALEPGALFPAGFKEVVALVSGPAAALDYDAALVEAVARAALPCIAPRTFVLLMGAPGSGKTTLARALDRAYPAAVHLAEAEMRRGFPPTLNIDPPLIVADATHPTAARRAVVLAWAATRRYATVIVHVATGPRLCEHLTMARAQTEGYLVPKIAHIMYRKQLEIPMAAEADHVATVSFAAAVDSPPEISRYRYL